MTECTKKYKTENRILEESCIYESMCRFYAANIQARVDILKVYNSVDKSQLIPLNNYNLLLVSGRKFGMQNSVQATKKIISTIWTEVQPKII